MISDQHKKQTMSSGRILLDCYSQDGGDLLSHIVTTINAATILHFSEITIISDTSRKIQPLFWDKKGVLVDLMEHGTTIRANV